jgi:hypothetical protein
MERYQRQTTARSAPRCLSGTVKRKARVQRRMLTPYVRGGSARKLLDVILQGIEQHYGIGRTEQLTTVWQFRNALDVPMNS